MDEPVQQLGGRLDRVLLLLGQPGVSRRLHVQYRVEGVLVIGHLRGGALASGGDCAGLLRGALACELRLVRLKSSCMKSSSTSTKNSLPLSEQNHEIQVVSSASDCESSDSSSDASSRETDSASPGAEADLFDSGGGSHAPGGPVGGICAGRGNV